MVGPPAAIRGLMTSRFEGSFYRDQWDVSRWVMSDKLPFQVVEWAAMCFGTNDIAYSNDNFREKKY